MQISKEFKFSAAHFLTKYHGKCEKLHGHTYKLRVTFEGAVKDDGMVVDFVEIGELVRERVLAKYDHASLNDFFENPTAENIAMQIWKDLEGGLGDGVRLKKVKVWESEDSFVTYCGK
ncbi:MAG: 6-carboxytetrahydropterin synthase QueD [Candidatus Gracilibacteria bacterium]|jgi:6-pyruvoyltetrahydropterin/6-carboxytetrahydropterin synthase